MKITDIKKFGHLIYSDTLNQSKNKVIAFPRLEPSNNEIKEKNPIC